MLKNRIAETLPKLTVSDVLKQLVFAHECRRRVAIVAVVSQRLNIHKAHLA